jgi:hypothetical protein
MPFASFLASYAFVLTRYNGFNAKIILQLAEPQSVR